MLDEPEPMAVVNETHRLFKDALDRGIADNVIPEAMSRKLDESLFVFSGFKTAQSLGEAASWLRQADGTVKPFNSFLTDVRKVNEKYNERYLRAEYEFAVGSAQMAASWAEVEASGDSYNLQYRTASDERVRSSHQAMADITLPPSDPFWDNYYPPNGWGCRCTAVQVRKAKYETTDPDQAMQAGNHATEIRGKDGANRGAMFRFNPGKQGQIFPPKHPYYKVANKQKAELNNLLKRKLNSINVDDYIDGDAVTNNDIKSIMHSYAQKFNENYQGGLIEVNIVKQGDFFMSNGRRISSPGNVLTIRDGNFRLSKGITFNPANEVKGALKAIQQGKDLAFQQEYAMESLWHETLHAKAQGWKDRSLRNNKTVMQMETVNQFVARKTYPQFIEQLGGQASNQAEVLERGYGYGSYVANFRKVLKHHNISEDETVSVMLDRLINQPYENTGRYTIDFLKTKGVKNARECMNSLNKATADFEKLLI